MGSWSIWHFIGFIAIAVVAAWSSRKRGARLDPKGLGGWLAVLIV